MLRLLVELERKVETEDKSSLVPSNPPGRVSSKRRPDGSSAKEPAATTRPLRFREKNGSDNVELSLSDQAMAIPHESGILRFLLENADISSAARTSRTWNQFSGSVSRGDSRNRREHDLPHLQAAERGDLDYILFLQKRHTQGHYKYAVLVDPKLLDRAAAHGRLHIVQYLCEIVRVDFNREPRLDILACGATGNAECFRYIRANCPFSLLKLCAKEASEAGNIECYQAIADLDKTSQERYWTRELLERALERGRVEFVSKFRDRYAGCVQRSPAEYRELMFISCKEPKLQILKIIDGAAPSFDPTAVARTRYDATIELIRHPRENSTLAQQAFECFRHLYEEIERDLDAQKTGEVINKAISGEHPLVLKYLLDRGVRVVDAFTAVCLAAEKRTSEMLAILHEHGVPWPATPAAAAQEADGGNYVILRCAVTNRENRVDCIRYILENRWCPYEPDTRLLSLALSSGNSLECLEYLFEKGYRFMTDEEQDQRLRNPLSFVRTADKADIFFWALSKGCPYDDDEFHHEFDSTLCEIAAGGSHNSSDFMRVACNYYTSRYLERDWGRTLELGCSHKNWRAVSFALRNGCPRPLSVARMLALISRSESRVGVDALDALRNSTVPPVPWIITDDTIARQVHESRFLLGRIAQTEYPERADAFSYIVRGGCPMVVEVACRVAIDWSWVEGIKCATDSGANRTIEDSNLALDLAKSSACFSYMMQDGFPRPTDPVLIHEFAKKANVCFLRVAHRLGIVGSRTNDIESILGGYLSGTIPGSDVGDDACLTYALENNFPLSSSLCVTAAEHGRLDFLEKFVQAGAPLDLVSTVSAIFRQRDEKTRVKQIECLEYVLKNGLSPKTGNNIIQPNPENGLELDYRPDVARTLTKYGYKLKY